VKKPIRFAREARRELLEASAWYARQRPGLQAVFLAAVDEALERVVRIGPRIARVPSVDPTLPVRRVFVRRFPYAVVFIELPTRVRVLAVAHYRRRPDYWQGRL
jgi:toxin ParE1/3/4